MENLSDADFAGRVLSRLPQQPLSAGFEVALLAGYDGWRARRAAGPLAGLAGALRGFADVVWPGAPLWLPAGALAASLILGIALGALLPAMEGQGMTFSLDRTPGFTLLADQEASL
jgi:hypothetical protein